MRLYRFHMPDTGNDGRDYADARLKFRDECLRLAGGYTLGQKVLGYWNEGGVTYLDLNWPIEVAVEDGKGEATRRRLVQLFKECFPDQLAVFSAEIGEAWIE